MTDKQYEIVKEKLEEYFENIDSDTLVEINNDFVDMTCNGMHVYDMGDFDSELGGYSPSEIANMVSNGEYNEYDEYFVYEDYDSVHTFGELSDYIETSDIMDYILENEEDFGQDAISDILKAGDEEEREIIIHENDNTETYTLKEFDEMWSNGENLFRTENGNVLRANEVLTLIDENNSNDDIELWIVDLTEEAKQVGGQRRATILRYEGWVFGDWEFENGIYFQWFYADNGMLLKLLYGKAPNGIDAEFDWSSPKYISEVKMTDRADIYFTINAYRK